MEGIGRFRLTRNRSKYASRATLLPHVSDDDRSFFLDFDGALPGGSFLKNGQGDRVFAKRMQIKLLRIGPWRLRQTRFQICQQLSGNRVSDINQPTENIRPFA